MVRNWFSIDCDLGARAGARGDAILAQERSHDGDLHSGSIREHSKRPTRSDGRISERGGVRTS